jgi:hypothetical protein
MTPPSPDASRTSSRSTLIGVIIAAVLLLGVVVYAIVALSGIGQVEMSASGWIAMLLGIALTLGLGFGLMALVFISNRRGYDEPGNDRR